VVRHGDRIGVVVSGLVAHAIGHAEVGVEAGLGCKSYSIEWVKTHY
jgi:hypothetical protein